MVIEHVFTSLVSADKSSTLNTLETWQNSVCFGNSVSHTLVAIICVVTDEPIEFEKGPV